MCSASARLFLRLGQGGRVQAFEQFHAAVQVIQQTGRDPRRIDLQALAARHSAQGGGYFAVIAQGHAILFENGAQLGAHFAQGDEQGGLLLADQGEGHEHRIERHIAAAQVEQPGDVIEGGDEVPVGTALFQHLTQFGEFFSPRLTVA